MARSPNILFLLSDQHSPHVCGWSGNRIIRTASLDRLAEGSAVFENAYCQNPLCVPSRASLLTGRYSRSIGIYNNRHMLEPNCVTFPRVLGAAGYRTCLVGKAHFNGEQFHGYGQRPYGDLFGQAHQPDPRRTPDRGPSGLGDLLATAGPSGIPLPLTQTEICVSESVKWLQTHTALHPQQPFCLSVHFDKPHFPINPPPAYFENYRERVTPASSSEGSAGTLPPFLQKAVERYGMTHHYGRNPELHQRALAAYYGCVEWIDNAIGRLLEVLDYLGLAENTIVIYTTDHGEMGTEHGLWQKTAFFEASARVPLLVRWPGRFAAGSRRREVVGLIDLFPTLCEAAGVRTPDTCEGVSLMPLLTDEGTITRDAIFSESVVLGEPEHAGCMIRTDKWKYNLYLDGFEELYDLEADPGELRNVAGLPQHTAVRDELRQRVEEFWRPGEQLQRFHRTPSVAHEKHFYPYSNQFLSGDGIVVDARP